MKGRGMRYALATIICVLVFGGSALMGGARADGASSLSASPYPTPTPTVDPPSTERVRAFCLKSRARAVKAYRKYARARACFGKRPLVHVSKRPAREASAVVWFDAREQWIHERVRMERLFRRLKEKMVRPGGSSNGVRWIPLARWCGWENRALRNLAQLIMNESSGRQNAVSATNDHGLVQFNAPSWAGTFKRVMKCSFFPHIYNPELNLRFAWYVYHVVQHNSFLPAWRGDPAAQW